MIGSSCETEVSTDCVLTRLPTCVVACPATPVISDAPGEAEIQFGRCHGSLCRLHGSFCLRLLLDLVVQLASGNRTRLGQRRVAIHVDLGQSELRLRLSQLPLRLSKRRLKRARIDLKEDLILLDLRAFAIILANQVSVRLRLNLGVDVAVERSNPLPGHRHIGLLSLDDCYFHGRRRTG